MKITPTQLFRDGRTTYEFGEEYDVPDADAVYFIRSGWATSPDYTPPGTGPAPASVDIQPDSVTHKSAATEVQ